MNSNEMIALELTKSYVDKCIGIDEKRIIEIYNSYYKELVQADIELKEIDDLRLELGKYKAFHDNLMELVQPDRNFVYVDDISKLEKETLDD